MKSSQPLPEPRYPNSTQLLGRYTVVDTLRRQTAGDLLLVTDTHLDARRLIEIAHDEPVSSGSSAERTRWLCQREGAVLARLEGTATPRIIEIVADAELGPLLVIEYLSGESLLTLMERVGPLSIDMLWPIAGGLWSALVKLHDRDIIHRDIKPFNVLLCEPAPTHPEVKLLDLACCKVIGETDFLVSGQSIGDFRYMPPEQIGRARDVDPRADIYAAATVLFEAITGQLPYDARNVLVLVERKSKTEPRRISEVLGTSVSPALDAFFVRALSRQPRARFGSAQEALNAWQGLSNLVAFA